MLLCWVKVVVWWMVQDDRILVGSSYKVIDLTLFGTHAFPVFNWACTMGEIKCQVYASLTSKRYYWHDFLQSDRLASTALGEGCENDGFGGSGVHGHREVGTLRVQDDGHFVPFVMVESCKGIKVYDGISHHWWQANCTSYSKSNPAITLITLLWIDRNTERHEQERLQFWANWSFICL